jgi:hypothetical protein
MDGYITNEQVQELRENNGMPNFSDFVNKKAIKDMAAELHVSEHWLSQNVMITGDHRGLYYTPTIPFIVIAKDSIEFDT